MILLERMIPMKKNNMVIILSLLSLIGTFIIYNRLPEQVPMHWNMRGEVDRYDPKYMVLIIGALPLALAVLKKVLPHIDPRRENYKKHGPAYSKIIFFTTLFLILINWTVIAISLGANLNIELMVPVGVGVLFIIMGNYMPQFRHNYFVGIKTPWTLADEDNWKKTHYIGGYVFMIDGLLFIISGLIRSEMAITVLLILMFISIGYLYVYSYLLYAKSQKSK